MICPFCKKEAEWVENKAVYGRNYGKSYMIWLCRECMAYVGCHNNTKTPLGVMATKETKQWRMKAHAVIDPLWRSGKYNRKKVYRMLTDAFGEEIHIGESDIKRCKEIIKTAEVLFTN